MESITNKWIRLMEIGKYSGCHQMAERSFFIHGYQFPLCARCTGMLVGEVVAYILLSVKILFSPLISAILLMIMGLDWFVQFIKIKESTNIRRFITGICGGIGITFLFVHSIIWLVKKLEHSYK